MKVVKPKTKGQQDGPKHLQKDSLSVKQDIHSKRNLQAQSMQEIVTSTASFSCGSVTCRSLAASCKLWQAKPKLSDRMSPYVK